MSWVEAPAELTLKVVKVCGARTLAQFKPGVEQEAWAVPAFGQILSAPVPVSSQY